MDKKTVDLLRLRAFLLKKTRSWFEENYYTEVQGPILVPSFAKSSNSFEVKYFGKKAIPN